MLTHQAFWAWSEIQVVSYFLSCYSLCLTLLLPLIVLFSEPEMSSCHKITFTNSSVQHHELSSQLKSSDLVMWPCKCCVSSHKKCQMSKDFNKCVACVKSDHLCNLAISHTEWDWVQQEQNHIHSELQTALMKTIHLQQQQELIESCWEKMIWQEFQNIEELKANKAKQASETAVMPSLNDFLLNMLFNQVKILIEFDPAYWSENVPFKDTSQ